MIRKGVEKQNKKIWITDLIGDMDRETSWAQKFSGCLARVTEESSDDNSLVSSRNIPPQKSNSRC